MTVEDLSPTIDSLTWPELTGDEDASAFVDRIERDRRDREFERRMREEAL
jgi:hypothetical protein